MRKIFFALITVAILAVEAGAHSATPEQAGIYVGTLKYKKYTLATGEKKTGSSGFQIELQADNDFTITYASGGSSSGTGFVGTEDGYLRAHSVGSTLTMPIHFVGNGVIKGTYHLGHGTEVWEAKFTVRRN